MKASVLIVDDEEIQRDMLGGYLRKKGYDIHIAPSGPHALDIIDKNTVDIVISDQKMPEMSGLELIGKICEEHPNISTIMLTAFGSIDDAVKAMKNGVDDYLTKPVKLLRVLQEREFERVGGNERIRVDVRIVAATNRNIEEEVKEGRFRQDLFYRLNVVVIDIPPLRKRRADIPVLVEHFIGFYSEEHGKNIQAITPEALDHLVKYPFPGNARELGNIIEQAVVLTRGDTITLRDMPMRIHSEEEDISSDLNLEEQVANIERARLKKALRETDGNKSAAARLLGISERKIRYMLKKYGDEF